MKGSNQEDAMPYCRCRVLYLGSSVPHASKEGLLGVQEPLRELYPEQGAISARGIDSWLSVWSNGLLLENVDEHRKKVTRFFPIESLHYCAAVRHVKSGNNDSSTTTRFLPLDSPFARNALPNNPPLFAAVLRRTTGIKVLECHAFICKCDKAANALVRCCFHAYADNNYAKGLDSNTTTITSNGSSPRSHLALNTNGNTNGNSNGSLYHTLGGSSSTLDNHSPSGTRIDAENSDEISLYNGDENHKVWAKGRDEIDTIYQEQGTLRSTRGSRPRQLVAPPPPPPPPPTSSSSSSSFVPNQTLLMDELSSGKKKSNKKLKKIKNRGHEETLIHPGHPGHPGHPIHSVHHQIHPQAIYGHHTLGHPIRQQHYHGHPLPPSSRSVGGTLARPAPVLLVPAATLPRKGHHHHHPSHHPRGLRPMPVPAAAPIVPIYAPLPVVPPPPPPGTIYQTAYGTAGNRGRRHHQDIEPSTLINNRRLAASHADLTAHETNGNINGNGHDNNDGDSRFGTGIYRRKGHLNERAFSYSIRAEHRSRSHGSLASLGFSPPNGTTLPKEEKKDREIAQMVAGLSLDDGERGTYMRNGHHQPQPLPRPVNIKQTKK